MAIGGEVTNVTCQTCIVYKTQTINLYNACMHTVRPTWTTHTHSHTHTHTHTYTHTHTHTYTHIHIHTHACMPTHTHTHTFSRVLTVIPAHSEMTRWSSLKLDRTSRRTGELRCGLTAKTTTWLCSTTSALFRVVRVPVACTQMTDTGLLHSFFIYIYIYIYNIYIYVLLMLINKQQNLSKTLTSDNSWKLHHNLCCHAHTKQ